MGTKRNGAFVFDYTPSSDFSSGKISKNKDIDIKICTTTSGLKVSSKRKVNAK